MTFTEMLKDAFVDGFVDLSLAQTILILLTSLACAALICLTYRLTYRGVLFSRSFCASLFAMALITTFLILAVRTNIYLSLGTLGALSIVRFRTAVKEPMDMAFLFLAISSGIVCGANLLGIAVSGVLFICLVLFLIGRLPHVGNSYIVMITTESTENESAVLAALETGTRTHKLKSKSILNGAVEYAYEVTLRAGDDSFISLIGSMPSVSACTVVKSNAEYV